MDGSIRVIDRIEGGIAVLVGDSGEKAEIPFRTCPQALMRAHACDRMGRDSPSTKTRKPPASGESSGSSTRSSLIS